MDAIWITLGMVVAVMGGWPVTAGILKFTKSGPVGAAAPGPSGNLGVVVPPAPDHPPAVPPSALPETPPTEAPSPETPPTSGAGPAPISGTAAAGAASGDGAPTVAPHGDVLRGGLLIGFLERAAVAVAIFSGQPVAIAYVVAIKGLGRYPELKQTPAASERFIIGTLASMLWAASVAALAKVLLL